MKYVLDTNVVVAAVRSPKGASAEILRMTLLKKVDVVCSVPLFLEYESVLKRPEHLLASGLLRPELVDRFLDSFLLHTEPVSVSYLWRPQLSDPADEMVLEAAVNGRADWIVTHNVRHFFAPAKKFNFGVAAPAPILHKLHKLAEGIDYASK